MTRIRVRHVATARYEGEATVAHFEARMLPTSGQGQFVLQSGVEVTPATSVQTYIDYWGTKVSAFDLHRSHSEVRVVAESVVDVAPRQRQAGSGLDWDALTLAIPTRVGLLEQVAPSALAVASEELVAAGQAAKDRGASIIEVAAELVDRGETHAVTGALRALGVPTRVVTGYSYAGDGEDAVPTSWYEIWDGSWRAPEHEQLRVRVGRGREASDLVWLHGLVAGVGEIERRDTVTLVEEN